MQDARSSRAVSEKPSVIGKLVAVGSIGDINVAVEKQQSRPLQMLPGNKGHTSVDRKGGVEARHGALNQNWAAKLFRSGCKAESMQTVHDAAMLAGGNSHIERAGRKIDNGSTAYADFGGNQSIGRLGNRRNSSRGIDEAAFPEGRGSLAIGLKGVHTAVFRSYENNVVL